MDQVNKPLMYGGLGSMYAIGALKQKLDKNPEAAATAKETADASKSIIKSIPKKIIGLSKDNNWSGSVKHTITPSSDIIKQTIPNQIKHVVKTYNNMA